MHLLADDPSRSLSPLSLPLPLPLPPYLVLFLHLQTLLLSNFPVQPSLVSRLALPSIGLPQIYHSNAARSPPRWTMPAFTPKQKRQTAACECFVLLPRHFLCFATSASPNKFGSIVTCVDGVHDPDPWHTYKSHLFSCLVCQLNVER